MPTLTLDDARTLAVDVLTRANTSPQNARATAAALVAAEADGLAGHGLSRLPAYADQAAAGKVDGHAEPEVHQGAAAAIRVDARSGFAYRAVALGLERGRAVVAETGIAAVAIANSHHFGAAGFHVEPLARDGLVALAFSNSPAAIAPRGGRRAVFGTNPIALAAPRRDAPPLVVDLSLSEVARGKINVAAAKGEPIPEGWALDAEGNPTTDAGAAMAGTMLPLGGAKGTALVLMVEVLSAVITGSNCGFQASSFFDAEGPPPAIGQFFVLLRPDPFAGGGDAFADRLEALLGAIGEQPGTRLPGQRRLENRARAEAEGISVPDALYGDLLRRAGGA